MILHNLLLLDYSNIWKHVGWIELLYLIYMQDNFFQQAYHSYDKVYTNEEYNNDIFIGDIQSATDSIFLQSNNILTVITAAKDLTNISIDKPIQHIIFPLVDGQRENISACFNQFFQTVQSNIRRGSILVHCAAGISRSSTLVISYIMKKQRLTFKEAIKIVRKSRPSVLPNIGFERQLKKYQHYFLDFREFDSVRRSQVKTSESGKIQNTFRLKVLPSLNPYKNISTIQIDPANRHSNSLNILKDGKSLNKSQGSKQRGQLNKYRRIYMRKGSKQVLSINKQATKTESFDAYQQPFFHISKLPTSQPISSNRSIYQISQIFKSKREENLKRKLKLSQKTSQFNFLLKINQISK